ncbi:baseplate J/gp47 family protein [Shewanella xiamenensis]|uniref:baseplate J/gp47 family protein n=1 Tax=Shewanella xiamenensis TaxID=332186 RepID=UPI0008499D0A|nr:baseplate J/gp47 family protein [Shewanella xiamenensis]ODR86702.1 hypothetical protein ABT47_16010 [Shewanella xiamenensis]
MAFNIPTLPALIAQGEQDIESHLEGSQPRLPFSVERGVNFATAAMVKDLYDHQSYLSRQIVPSLDSDEQTIVDAAARRGIVRKAASYAMGPVAFVAANGATLSAGTKLQRGDRVVFEAVMDATAQNGQLIVNVQATTPGTASNTLAGTDMRLMGTSAGVTSSGKVLVPGIVGGNEQETLEALLERLRFRMRYPPQGGAAHDYQRWAMEVPGVTRAWTYPTWWGLGTVGLAFVRDYDEPIFPTSAQQQSVAQYIYRHVDPATNIDVGNPVGAELVMISLRQKPITLTIGGVENGLKRATILQELRELSRRSIIPGFTLKPTHVQAAIVRAGVDDYTLSLVANVSSDADELIYFAGVTWL